VQGQELTYEILGTSTNEAAIDVLIAALDDPDATTRRLALCALTSRNEARAAELVLQNWSKLRPDDLRILRPKKKWLSGAVAAALESDGSLTLTAISATKTLQLTEVISPLAVLAESSKRCEIKQQATAAIIRIVEPLGENARRDRGSSLIRGPVHARLADSIRRFPMHRNPQMVDAFLIASCWADASLREFLNDGSPEFEVICQRLEKCAHPGIEELLAGFVRRRNVDDQILTIVQSRDQETFRDALLRTIGPEPSATTLKNLQQIGLPRSLRGGEAVASAVSSKHRAALIHAYASSCSDSIEALHTIAAIVELGGSKCEAAAASALPHVEVPDTDFWMRAALPVADNDQQAIQQDRNASLLKRLINLLDHPEPGVRRAVQGVLQPMHADAMIGRFESLRPRSRRRLGRVVMMVDPDALQRVRDALRHPVLEQRLKAIAMADALAAVDLLSDSFEHIAREDHQQARIRAAGVMGDAEGEITRGLLEEMLSLPACPVRDAAAAAIEKRMPANA